MQERTTQEDGMLLDAVIQMMGYASTNRGRKAIKEGYVKVNGKLITMPATPIQRGARIQVFDKPQRRTTVGPRALSFTIHHDDRSVFAFEKPAGWISASPDRKKRTAFTTALNWLMARDPKMKECYFVNKLPKEASGLMILAKDATTRTFLQRDWNKLTKRYYVIAKGQFEEDGVIGQAPKGKKADEKKAFVFPYRRMMQGNQFALLRVDMKEEAFSELFALLEAAGTPVPGFARRGKADNPMGRIGFHFFSVELPLGPDKTELIKTPVPREFLNLIKFNTGA